MGFFRGSPKPLDAPGGRVAGAETPRTRRGIWADGLGSLAIRSAQILLVLAVVVLGVLAVRELTLVTIPLLLALIFASAFSPAITWMRAHRVPSLVATLLTFLAIVVGLGLLGWFIVRAVSNQWDELYARAREGVLQVVAWLQTADFLPDEWLEAFAEAPSEEQLQEWLDAIVGFVTSAQFGSGALAGVSAVASFATGLVLMIVILFFFLKDGPRMWEFLLRPFHGDDYARARRIGDKTVTTLGSYVRGTATIALVDAVGIGIGLAILQVPLALPLAVLVFLLAFIPIVGATLAGTLAALVALVANGPLIALVVVGVVIAVNQLEGNLLQPVLMGRTMKLHAFVVLVALAIGIALGGVLGGVLAVPLTAVGWGIVQVWDGPETPARWARAKPVEAQR